jgi:anti-anti-sigma factor
MALCGLLDRSPFKGISGGMLNNLSVLVSDHVEHKEITVITIKGSIDTTTAPAFEEKFLSALRAKKFKLVIDLGEVDYISSAGWGLFVSEIKQIRAQKGDLLLAGMIPEVSEIYELLEFNTFLKCYSSVESAVARGFGNLRTVQNKEVPVNRLPKENP